MRNKREFSLMILLLLMEYTLSKDSCQVAPLLGQLSFGSFLPRSVFTTKYQISIYQCATECQLRIRRCKSFNYRRTALSCQLCEEDSGPGGISLQAKAGTDHSNIDTWKNMPIRHCSKRNCSWTERCDPSNVDPQSSCVTTECQFAVLKPGVTIDPSNETAVGTKARYRCVSEEMERGRYLTACLASTAEWNPTDFKCGYSDVAAYILYDVGFNAHEMQRTSERTGPMTKLCKPPMAKSGTIFEAAEVELGQNYTYRCQHGLIGKRDLNPTVMCQLGGDWTTTNFTCVCKTPMAKSGTIIEAAEVELGQNYTYRCQDGLIGKIDLNPTVMCQPGGDWTTTNFTCVCTIPAKSGAINPTAEVEIGQNYTYRCDINFFKKGDENPTITCLHDGNWTSTNFICVTQNWTLDTVFPNNIHTSEVISNQSGIHLLTCMQECDNEPTKCFSFFYDNQTGLCLLSSSFQRGWPNGFQFSDGVVYYTAPSSSCDSQYRNGTLAGSYFCIKYHNEPKSFNEAMKSCESEKAKLLVVTTKDQISDIGNIWPIYCMEVYIGLSDQIEEGHWLSWNGEIVHPFWSSGQPSNNSKEDCGRVYEKSIRDTNCDLTYPFLCHKIHF